MVFTKKSHRRVSILWVSHPPGGAWIRGKFRGGKKIGFKMAWNQRGGNCGPPGNSLTRKKRKKSRFPEKVQKR